MAHLGAEHVKNVPRLRPPVGVEDDDHALHVDRVRSLRCYMRDKAQAPECPPGSPVCRYGAARADDRSAAAPAAVPPPIPSRLGGGGCRPAGPRLRHPLLVAGRGLAARAHPTPLPAGPVHPRRRRTRRLTNADSRLRERGRYAPRSCHLRLSLGLADPGSPPPAESPPVAAGTGLPSAFSAGPIPPAGSVVSYRSGKST